MPNESTQFETRRHQTQTFDWFSDGSRATSNAPEDVPPKTPNNASMGTPEGTSPQPIASAGTSTASTASTASNEEGRRFVVGLRDLSNDQVTRRVVRLNRTQRLINAELLLYLSELDARKLYRYHNCASTFDFLTTRLGQSEDVAYRWMWGARLLRAFPLVYDLLVNGRLHLSALMLLKPHLTEKNHHEWLMAAADKSKRDVEKLVAARCPRANVPARVRKLPDAALRQSDDCAVRSFAQETHLAVVATHVTAPSVPGPPAVREPPVVLATTLIPMTPFISTAPAASATHATSSTARRQGLGITESSFAVLTESLASGESSAFATSSLPLEPIESTATSNMPLLLHEPIQPDRETIAPRLETPSRAPKIRPLSEHSYRVVFTASQRLKEKLERAGELLSHAVSPKDLPTLVERALDLLIAREETRKYGSRRETASTPPTNETVGRSVKDAARNEEEQLTIASDATLQNSGAGPHQDTVGVDSLGTDLVSVTTTTVDIDRKGNTTHSRRPGARVRRQVWERDAGQCTYVDSEGGRCQNRHRLEFDHCVAYALGGETTVANLRVRCRIHNALAAEQVFGAQRIAAAISAARERRSRHRP